MPIDEVAGVLLRRIRVECRAEMLRDRSGSAVLRVHIAGEAIEVERLCSPIPQRPRRLRRISPSLVFLVHEPPKLFLGKQGPMVDADLSCALAGGAEVHHQRAVPEHLPARDVVAKYAPRRPPSEGGAHVLRPQGCVESRIGREIVDDGFCE